MAFNEYSTHTLMGVIRTLPTLSTFWLNTCFGRQVNFTDQYVDFDRIVKGRKLAPFVAPSVQGKVDKKRGFTTSRFAPAYVKPKDIVDPNHLITRMAGEAYTGEMSPQQRRDAIMADLLQGQKDKITRRKEWMAAQAILEGKVTVEGEDYPTQVVDFGRDASLNIALTGGAQWGQAGVNIVDLIEDWNDMVMQKSTYAPTMVVFGTDAWKAARDDAGLRDLMDKNFRNGDAATLDLAPANGEVLRRVGQIGTQSLWVYNDFYEDDNGAVQPFMSSKKVVGLNPMGVQGVRCFGAIMDAEAGYAATDMFSKNWVEKDPSVEYLMTQSAPLMVPMEPNAVWSAEVLE